MSTESAVGLVMVVVAALVWVVGAAALARANPDQRIAYPENERYGGYLGALLVGLAVGLVGCFTIDHTYGLWGYAAGVALFAAPVLILVRVHNRRLAQRRLAADPEPGAVGGPGV